MRASFFKEFALTVLVILALLVPASAVAGQGPPVDGWKEIAPGAIHHYSFRYHYDNRQTGDEEEIEPTEALVILRAADETRTVNFVVNTAETLKLPKSQKDADKDKPSAPLGVGSPMNIGSHQECRSPRNYLATRDEHGMCLDWTTMVWSGATIENVTFYVDVKNSGTKTSVYQLSITGPDVSNVTVLP